MKYKIAILTIILANLVMIYCSKIDLGYKVKAGDNIFQPYTPTVPFIGDTWDATIEIGEEWWEGHLTEPVGYGCKLHCIGKLNYHNGGCNFAISYTCPTGSDHGRVFLSARYYEPIESGYYRLHECLAVKEMHPDVPIRAKIVFSDSTRFYIDGILMATVMPLPHGWIAPPFLGRSGNDNNYGANPIPGAFAQRDLYLKITMR